ncbi:MAG: AMP-binding protein, partial [Acidimicrobiales bacterium]
MNLAQIIEPHPGDAAALRYSGEEITYGELRRRAANMRLALAGRGISPGDRVALLLGATPEFAIAYFGILGAGAVAVPLNPNSPIAEIARELSVVRAALVVVADGLRNGSTEHGDGLMDLGYVVAKLSEFDPPPRAVGEADQSSTEPGPIVECDPDDPAVLLFTSGTAGSPRAAVLTHGSLLANIEQVEMRVGRAATAE